MNGHRPKRKVASSTLAWGTTSAPPIPGPPQDHVRAGHEMRLATWPSTATLRRPMSSTTDTGPRSRVTPPGPRRPLRRRQDRTTRCWCVDRRRLPLDQRPPAGPARPGRSSRGRARCSSTPGRRSRLGVSARPRPAWALRAAARGTRTRRPRPSLLGFGPPTGSEPTTQGRLRAVNTTVPDSTARASSGAQPLLTSARRRSRASS